MMSANYQTYKEIIAVTVLTLYICATFLSKSKKSVLEFASEVSLTEFLIGIVMLFLYVVGCMYCVLFVLQAGFYFIETHIMG